MIFKVGQKVTQRSTGLSGKVVHIFSHNEYVVKFDHLGMYSLHKAELQKITRKKG